MRRNVKRLVTSVLQLLFLVVFIVFCVTLINPSKNVIQEKDELRNQEKDAKNIQNRIRILQDLSTPNITEGFRKGFLTIGLPTAKRTKESYLRTTLESLFNNTSQDSKLNIRIVILLADIQQTDREEKRKEIMTYFKTQVDTGQINLISIPDGYYPNFSRLKSTFGDKMDRVQWRSKQNLDYAYLMSFSSNISKYYMQLEDDVIASKNYVTKIKEFIDKQKSSWTMLEFTRNGFIGKLYHSEDVTKLASFLNTFYNEQPCDFLMLHFIKLMLQENRITRFPKLFKHLGIHSTFESNKRGSDLAPYDDDLGASIKGDNPAADVVTSLKAAEAYSIESCYNQEEDNSVFWSLKPKIHDTIIINFKTMQILCRVLIVTGFPDETRDRLENGVLEVGSKIDKMSQCTETTQLGEFNNGKIDVNITKSFEAACLKITITKEQKEWILFSNFAVFIQK